MHFRPPRSPRLLTLTPDFPPSVGGIQLLLERLLQHLPEWEHRVVARRAAGPESPVPSWRTRRVAGPSSIAELNVLGARAGRRWAPDVVLNGHVHTTPGALAVAARRDTPIVTYAYADELTHRPALTRLAARRSSAMIAISRYTADLIHEHHPRGPVDLVLPGFDQRAVLPAPASRPTLLTVARLADRYKGHDVVLQALPAVLERFPDAQWVIAGDGPLRGDLEARAASLGVSDSVRFLGYVDDAQRAELLSRAWVFVMPSRLPPRGAGGEGFGIVYLEAAEAGVPVVAGNVAGALDAVDDGRSGLLVDPERPEAVAGALLRLLSDPRERRTMAAHGPEWAARFTWPRMAAQVDHVLRRELGRG